MNDLNKMIEKANMILADKNKQLMKRERRKLHIKIKKRIIEVKGDKNE